MSKGMLATTAASRPSFARHLFGLYRSDTVFRSLVDFTAIGAVVLVFLQFFPSKGDNRRPAPEPSRVEKAAPSNPVPPQKTVEAAKSSASKTIEPAKPAPSVPANPPPKAAMEFPGVVSTPALGATRIYDIDQSIFHSSSVADQSRLAAALRAVRTQQFPEIAGILADANAADPNVALMRGIGLISAGTADGNKVAAQSWRTAAEAGQQHAALELARIEVYGPPGVTKNVEQAKRMIETAAAAGNRQAQRMADIAFLSAQFGLDPTKARDLLHRAAQAGDVEVMLYYAFILAWAVGGPVDQTTAEDFLRRAAAAGDCFHNFGTLSMRRRA